MKVCALQLNIKLADRPFNYANAAQHIATAMLGKPDVLVFPELWDVGFYPANLQEVGDDNGERAQNFLSAQARKYNVNIVGGSIARREGNKVWNTTYVYNRQGSFVASYDKIHLFSPAGEHEKLEAGNCLVTYKLDDIKAGSIICYDLLFGELTRSLALQDAHIIFAPAAWPHPGLNQWQCLTQARAIENQVFVVAVNAVGIANTLEFCGHSTIISPWGDVIAQAGQGEQLLMGECNMSIVDTTRNRINIFRDRRPELYQVQ